MTDAPPAAGVIQRLVREMQEAADAQTAQAFDRLSLPPINGVPFDVIHQAVEARTAETFRRLPMLPIVNRRWPAPVGQTLGSLTEAPKYFLAWVLWVDEAVTEDGSAPTGKLRAEMRTISNTLRSVGRYWECLSTIDRLGPDRGASALVALGARFAEPRSGFGDIFKMQFQANRGRPEGRGGYKIEDTPIVQEARDCIAAGEPKPKVIARLAPQMKGNSDAAKRHRLRLRLRE
jgi:hypothetical protein